MGSFPHVPPGVDALSFLAGVAAAAGAGLAASALVRGRRRLRAALSAGVLEPCGRALLRLAAAARGDGRAAPALPIRAHDAGVAPARPAPAAGPPAPPEPEAPRGGDPGGDGAVAIEPLEDGGGAAPVAAAAEALREPLGRAAAASSYVRLLAPPLSPRASAALDQLDVALEDLSRRLSALAVGEGGAGGARVLALAPILRDLLAAFAPPSGVGVRAALADVTARADERALRAALREALRAAAASAPRGREVSVTLEERWGAPVVEIAGGGARRDGAAALARALVSPHGGVVEEEPAAGGGRTLRLVLARAPAAPPALAHEPPSASPAR